jgi:hypothetical protein
MFVSFEILLPTSQSPHKASPNTHLSVLSWSFPHTLFGPISKLPHHLHVHSNSLPSTLRTTPKARPSHTHTLSSPLLRLFYNNKVPACPIVYPYVQMYLYCTLPEHLSSPPVFSGVRVTRSLVLYVCFVDRCLSFCTFSFGHCVVCSSSIYEFRLPLWYLQTLHRYILIKYRII